LQAVGYDGVVSIEHEDVRLDRREAIPSAIAFLQELLGDLGHADLGPREAKGAFAEP
jgi:hypothetical protein